MLTRAPQIAGAGAALTALIALAHAQDLCDSMQIGNETQFALSLAERRVEPHMFTLEISESDVCSASEAAGLRVTACDREQAPRVYLLDTARGVVVREGSVATPAYVYITVYCASDSEEALDASAKSPVVSNRFLEEALLQSSSIPSPPLPLPPTVRFVSSPTILSAQPRSISTPDSLPPSEVEPPSVLTSATDEYLPPVQLESRFSSLDQSIPTILSSRLKDLWNGRAASSLGQLKSQTYPKSISSRSQENEPSLLDKAKNQPSILDSYSSLLNGLPKWPQNPSSSLPDTSSSSLAKRLTDLRPKQPSKWLANRSPAWLKRPTRRPSAPWLKLRSLPDEKTRKSMAWSRNRPSSRTSDYGDSWSPYDVDQLSLHWSDEPTDPNTWYTDGEPHSQYYVNSGGPSRSKHPQAHHFLEGPPSSLSHESPSSAITHMSKKQIRYVPPIHEEDPALLAKWKRDLHRLPRPLLPKLLLLLQEQDHPALLQRKSASAHSIEDDEPLWLNQPFKENLDEGFPWQADYPADYSADDGDSHSYLPEHYIDDREQSPHFAPVYIEEPEHPRCPQCGPEHHGDARHTTRAPHFPWHPGAESPQVLPHPPLVSFDSQSYLPERHTDDREQSPHFAPVYIEEPEHPRCPQCGPGHPGDARHPTRAPHFPWHPGAESPQVLPHPPLVSFDSQSYLPERYTDDRAQSPHFAPVYIEEPKQPRCPQCGPEYPGDARHPTRAPHFPWHPGAESPQVLPHPPLVSFDSQSYLPERYTDDRAQSPHFAPVYIEEQEHPRCPQCGPEHPGDARHPTRAPHFSWHPGAESPQVLPHPPLVFFYSQSYLPERYTDDREQSPHFAPVYIEEPEHSRCPQCGPEHPGDARHPTRAPHFPWHPGAESPQVLPHLPLEYFDYYSPTSPTERPLPTSKVRHSLSWVKSSNPLTPMQLQHRSLKAEPSEHHPSAAPWSFLSQLLLSHPTFRDSTHVIRIR